MNQIVGTNGFCNHPVARDVWAIVVRRMQRMETTDGRFQDAALDRNLGSARVRMFIARFVGRVSAVRFHAWVRYVMRAAPKDAMREHM